MERFFKLSDSLETLGPEYNKYASGKISYEKLESLINKINNKRVSAKETPKEEIS